MKNRILLSFLSLFIFSSSFSQKWQKVENKSFKSVEEQRLTAPIKYESYVLDFDHIKSVLNEAPKRFTSNEDGITINWPMPGNKIQKFTVNRSDVFHPELAAKYPDIKAFTGHSKSDPTAILKISISHKGLEGMLLSSRHETIYLDRFTPKSKGEYILYERSNYHRELEESEGSCTVEIPEDGYKGIDNSIRFGDCQLRKFRLALACTGEYASFHGGNIPDVLAEYNASLVRVNGIYERDLAITMELVANTDELIFLSTNTDPYTNNDGVAMLSQNQSTVDQIIGFDNYDIGHVYSTGGGGIASLRSPCTNRKARGVTGLGNPTGDFFWVDYVAHEMGHQFGGNHTFNNSCNNNRSSNTAIEPGSGATIMAYAGICSPNVQNNSDDYFHSVSQSEIANFVVAGNGDCAEIIDIDNSPPEIESINTPTNVLPSRTPFLLTATATDPDGDLLTYCWEQIDNEIADMPPVSSSNDGPAFRSYLPNESESRYFPRLTSIITGANGNTWEVLPNSNRNMDFNLTVRDNNPMVGCTDDEEVSLNFTTEAGPFLITSQNSTTTWNAGEPETVTWDVANTDMPPVSCETVDILFSSDRANTFNLILAENVINDGEHDIIVPFEFTSQGRIMLKCSSSIFFDINNRDINVIAPFAADVSPTNISVCPGSTAVYKIDYTIFGSTPVLSTFTLNGLPESATHTFSPAQADVDTEVTLTIDNLTSNLSGSIALDIIIQSSTVIQTQPINLIIEPDQNENITYLTPAEGQTGISITPLLSWSPVNGISNYEVEVSENPNFENIIFSGSTSSTFISPQGLNPITIYYWRVRGVSSCVDPLWLDNQSFQTSGVTCLTTEEDANIEIDENSGNTIESKIELTNTGLLGGIEISMNIEHNFVGDLSGRLMAPNGLILTLFEQPGVPNSDFGCDQNNIVVTFSANATNTADDFENSCNSMGNAIEGIFQPFESFSLLNNIPIQGTWTLIIEDIVGPDGGILIDWSITACEAISQEPGVILKNNILQLNNNTEGLITNTLLEMENSDPINTLFMVRNTPIYGEIQKWNETTSIFELLNLGDTFTQDDVNQNRIKYLLLDLNAASDSFIFDAENDQSRFTSNNTFAITASIAALSISATVSDQISCFGQTDGRIEVMGIGGIPGYMYSINEGPFDTQNIFENLGAGEYTITVRDDVGSESSSSVLTIIEPSPITFSILTGDNAITIDAEGGTGSYMYSIDGINYVTNNTIEIFDGETYQIHVKDENDCVLMFSSVITFYQISGIDISTVNVNCKGDNTGSITVNNVIGGESPYTYQLNQETATEESAFNNLSAGLYTIIITDASGNMFEEMNIQIIESEFDLDLGYGVVEDQVDLNGTGGSEPYQYSIDGVNYTDSGEFLDLDNGDYIGYVEDSKGCIDTVTFTILVISTSNVILDQLQLFPNPTILNFTLSSPSSLRLDYQIIDITGKIISQNSEIANNTINVDNLSSGLYMIKVSYKDSFRIFKLSKI